MENRTPAPITTPCYVCDESVLESNLRVVRRLQQKTDCKVLLALKAFAMHSIFPKLREHLHGTAASSLHEARLGYEDFGGSVHCFAPAYRDDEIDSLIDYSSHMVFNSFSQWRRFKHKVMSRTSSPLCAIRINPEHSEVETEIYDPCAPGSRFGVTRRDFLSDQLQGISGLHFHTLCGSNSDALLRTVNKIEERFGEFLPSMSWINLGGGHHICRDDYDLELLCEIVNGLTRRYDLEVFLEPGEGLLIDAGTLEATVLDILPGNTVILDASATAHMPDVLEMPYRVDISGAGEPGEFEHNYRLGGLTCMAGDFFGDYSFPYLLKVGSRLVFEDMLPYTMVKNTTFNGVRLPSIAVREAASGQVRLVREFGYEDYRNRLS
jgi:carboxynorspermidine decarboxylase